MANQRNKNRSQWLMRSFLLLALPAATVPAAFGQLNSNTATVSLTATLGETLTVAATPGSVSFALIQNGVAAGNNPVAITTTWILGAGRANVELDAYFTSSTAALSGGSPVTNIPTSSVLGQMTTGTPTTFSAFTQTASLGSAGSGLVLFTQALSSSNRQASRTDNLNLEISATGLPQLPAGTYTGSLTIQAQAL